MTLDSMLGVGLFAWATSLLALTALRLVSAISPRGLERGLATAVCAAALAVTESLALGRFDLGTNRFALLASTLIAWGLSRAVLPTPSVRLRDELPEAWRSLDPRARTVAGAAGGLGIAWAGLSLLQPSLDQDSAYYHLPTVVNWIANGSPGSIEVVSAAFPTGNYPITNEVLLSWIGGISHNIGFLLLWPVACAGLLAGSVWLALRALSCPRWAAGAAIAALLLIPVVARAVSSLDTDLASITWLAVCVALGVRAGTGRARPELLAVATVALALAVGTKTSVAPIGLAALTAALVASPGRPRALTMATALVVSLGVGGVWYLRNWFEHGSPLWPFVETPGADPLPPAIDGFGVRFIDNPIGTLDGRVGEYLSDLGAGPLLMLSAGVLALLSGDRRLRLGGLAVAVSGFVWAMAPVTGAPSGDASFFTTTGDRYLMGTLLLSAGVLALVASRRGAVARVAGALLISAAAWGAIDLLIGGDESPSGWVLLAGAAVGGAIAAAVQSAAGPARGGRMAVSVAVASVTILLAIAAYPAEFPSRFRAAGAISGPFEPTLTGIPQLLRFFGEVPGFADGEETLRFAGAPIIGPLTGGSLRHDVELADANDPCAGASASGAGWLVITADAAREPAADCLRDLEPEATLGAGSLLELEVYRFPPPA